MERVSEILQRIDSCHLAHLWSFYRPAFKNDEQCMDFFHLVFALEPADKTIEFDDETDDIVYMARERVPIEDKIFIPRRMVNCVERLVLAARDMEQIRPGKDIFKIIYIITCAESLQLLSGKNLGKGEAVHTFFENAASSCDKAFIGEHFSCIEKMGASEEERFRYFIGVMNELRNGAAHEGNFWDMCFATGRDNSGQVFTMDIDLEKYSFKNKTLHGFITKITYPGFEAIFIRTCIAFIKNYVKEHQKDAPNANT